MKSRVMGIVAVVALGLCLAWVFKGCTSAVALQNAVKYSAPATADSVADAGIDRRIERQIELAPAARGSGIGSGSSAGQRSILESFATPNPASPSRRKRPPPGTRSPT